MSQFRLPDLGEGLEEAQVVQWLVRVGDRVQLNQPICQVETAKAMVDIPSPFAGTVQQLHARPGESVAVGAPLITIAEAGSPAGASAAQADGHGPVLVGYGTDAPRTAFARKPRGVAGAVASAARTAHDADPRLDAPTPALSGADIDRASPLVRKIAAERGIDLSAIAGTGPGGRIRVEDLEARTSAARLPSPPSPPMAPVAPMTQSAASDEERISTIGLRKAIAARMVRAATTIPHFTEYSLFDAAALVALRDRLKGDRAYAESKLTFLPFFVRAVVEAVKAYPILNSRWDEEGNAIVIKRSISVGVATDTPRGLLVPVVRDTHRLSLAEIAAECNRLVQLARDGKLDAKSLSGSTITVTNVGAAGPVDTGAPLINPPEACVVGFGAIKPRPMAVGNEVRVRPSCWISLSADHRIVDGAAAAQFMGVLMNALEHPETLV